MRRLGVAVGRRAAYGTYTVREDGIERQEVADYPEDYHWGLLHGSLVDQNWNLCAHADSIKDLFNLLLGVYGSTDHLVGKVIGAYTDMQELDFAYRFDVEQRQEVASVLYKLSSECSNVPLADVLSKIASVVQADEETALDDVPF